ncbi:MAG: MbtH family NRPS accessory protein [Planctomycetaceae bacterium]|nr:MbtH family NRPS accessory protein [Planctomycetaceae bacterium]
MVPPPLARLVNQQGAESLWAADLGPPEGETTTGGSETRCACSGLALAT